MGNFKLKQSDDLAGSDQREPVAGVLAQSLADTYTLYLKTQNFHWNVEGPRFVGIHTLTEEHYQNLALAVDTLAERIRALGFYAPGSYKEYAQMSSIEEVEGGALDSEKMLKTLVDDHMSLVSKIKESIEVAEKHGDSTTADMLSERRDFHEQAAWMLRSLGK
ncbi:Dps family protein [Pseudobacteriovorax antillogorgiicola]|uniref:Starvation-inducible DNA-binding protein n=1 Tax=Pseudobacteriovorax antillogorgiicola TaxID=1513793 RepID=A0A1Y6BCY2_9BACT|nr:DNA starvation/stationary phase protection protein [Pseudobacteriovorax antillogorgiicola]TCS57263.1 starvation-inducible DNA-binding protein [Pseudobacteriovorax antillogorgiicola]SMF03277.1 starvation-inducible DNA-binding protein [Pseudobacteriovorax antillogorgiicola]